MTEGAASCSAFGLRGAFLSEAPRYHGADAPNAPMPRFTAWSRAVMEIEHESRRFRAQQARYGCEPPPAQFRQDAGNRVWRQQRAATGRTRSQRPLARPEEGSVPLV